MSTIQEFLVTEPPTSEEVRDRVAAAIRYRNPLELILLPEQDIPAPRGILLIFPMRHINLRANGQLDIEGNTDTYSSIVVRTHESDSEPATASIVIP